MLTLKIFFKDFQYMKQREEEMRSTNESTNSRVLYFSIFSMLCLGMCLYPPIHYTFKSTVFTLKKLRNYKRRGIPKGRKINSIKSVWQRGKFSTLENFSNQRNSSNNFKLYCTSTTPVPRSQNYLWCWRRPNIPIIILESL